MHDFKRLRVWQEARVLGTDVHRVTRAFPRVDRGALAAQLQRSALSIAATIAEGCGKSTRAETVRYLEMASGSAAATEHHLIVAGDLDFIPNKAGSELCSRAISIQRMLRALIRTLPP